MQKSIRKFIFSILSVMLFVLFLMYSAVALLMLDKGADITVVWAFDELIKEYNVAYQADPNAPLPEEAYLWLKKVPTELPDNLALFFANSSLENGYQNIDWQESRYIVGVKKLHDGSSIYLAADIDNLWDAYYELPEDVLLYIEQAITPLIFTLIVAILLAFIVITWMTITFLRPLKKLALWVENLTPALAHQPAPDFSFVELNAVAQPFQQSLLEVEGMIAKEQFFMRTTSHELRTPLAVASANVELLNRLLTREQISDDCQITVARIERAVADMSNITEAVLWLGRGNKDGLVEQEIVLIQVVNELLESNNYLVEGKEMSFKLQFENYTIKAPLTPCKMVISNLIRNAMQYTQQGIIHIHLSSRYLTIRNEDINHIAEPKHSADYGFGLGLVVVERICQLMGWSYSHQLITGGREVTLHFGDM